MLVRRLRDAAERSRARRRGRPLALAQQLGLVGERRGGGGHYDRFRARLMFPITDSAGRVVGFGSRSVPGTPSANADLPKYLNSPETPLYRKGSHLYGLSRRARGHPHRAGARVVVEGYFDVLALAEAGVEPRRGLARHRAHPRSAPAPAALHPRHRRLLRRRRRRARGPPRRASRRSSRPGLWGHGAFLPPGDDPDTFVQREGQRRRAGAARRRRRRSSTSTSIARSVRRARVAERGAVAQQVATWLRKIADPFEYDMTVRHAAERLRVPEESLRRNAGDAASAGARAAPAARRAPHARVAAPTPQAASAEELLVTLMLQRSRASATRVDAEGALEFFDEGPWRALADRSRRGGAARRAARFGDGARASRRRERGAHHRTIARERRRRGDAATDCR